jgi:dephospho-CoA kinase
MNSKATSCFKIGVTGGIGSGKSTVCKYIEQLGYPVFYSDQEAKKIISNDREVKEKIVALFGTAAYEGGQLNRSHLANNAFANPELLNKLNSIIHPAVREAFESFVIANCSQKLVFNEAAILFETGAHKNFDFNILVVAPKDLRISRIMERDNLDEHQVESRMKNQWEDEDKIPLADYVIYNSQNMDLSTEIKKIVSTLEAKIGQKK